MAATATPATTAPITDRTRAIEQVWKLAKAENWHIMDASWDGLNLISFMQYNTDQSRPVSKFCHAEALVLTAPSVT